jgi:uncharacterized protein (TIGR00290 family)
MEKIPAYMNWSGGKDSSLALYTVLLEGNYDVKALVTTVNAAHQRISMHGVRRELLHEQALQIGIPVIEILLPDSPDMEAYETAMTAGLQPLLDQGIRHCIFGDIFLEDLRTYRENKLKEIGVTGIFPLWKRDTTELVSSFIDLGFKTIVVCTQADKLDASFAGRVIDPAFLSDLPATVDPCGENGEFHTFVYDGPIFRQPVAFGIGEKVFRTYETSKKTDDVCSGESWGFHYVDLEPVAHPSLLQGT